jgi:hypothetical protein
MSEFLFDVQNKNRLKQDGLLQRFSITCYGKQETVEEMRAEKAAKFKEMKDKRGTPEFEEWFLNYKPGDKPERPKTKIVAQDKPIKYLKKKNTKRKKLLRSTKKQYGNFLWGNNKTRKQKYY